MANESGNEELVSGVDSESNWTDLYRFVDVLALLGAIGLFIFGEYEAAAVLFLVSIRIELGRLA